MSTTGTEQDERLQQIERALREQIADRIEAERSGDDDDWDYDMGLLKAAAIAREAS